MYILIVSMKAIALDITIAAQWKRVVLIVETNYDITKKFQNNIICNKVSRKIYN